MIAKLADLIAEIRAAPDEDAPRLVCADWLEEQGDEASVGRAQFIRTQIERARLAPDDPRQSQLHAVELRLLKRFATNWKSSHVGFGRARFRRGFMEAAVLGLEHVCQDLPAMLELEPVRKIELKWNAPHLASGVADCPHWRSIESIRIRRPRRSYGPQAELVDEFLTSPYFGNLQRLFCKQLNLDQEAMSRFRQLPLLNQLHELELPKLHEQRNRGRTWSSSHDDGFADTLAQLESLNMTLGIDDSEPLLIEQLTNSRCWQRLKKLKIVFEGSTATGETVMTAINELSPAIRDLAINARPAMRYPLSQRTERILSRVEELSPERIRFSYLTLTPQQVSRIGCLGPGLKQLTLICCGLTDEHAAALGSSPGLSDLWTLNLSANHGIDADAAQQLFSSQRSCRLIELDLRSTTIGSEGIEALSQWSGGDKLRVLNLREADASDESLQMLLQSDNAQQLTTLSISDFRREQLEISDATIGQLAELPNLVNLSLSGIRYQGNRLNDLSRIPWRWISLGFSEQQRSYEYDYWPPQDELFERRGYVIDLPHKAPDA